MEIEKVIVADDAPVLVPNAKYKNFTQTSEIIPQGATIEGGYAVCKGLKKGEPFEYRIFKTIDNKIIFQKYVTPTNMETTEIKLGADSAQTPTDVKVPSNATPNRAPWIGLAIGIIGGFGFAKYKKWDRKKTIAAMAVGAAVGFGSGKVFFGNKKGVVVKKSK